ncbi:MAG: MlaD family protein [Planctomycetota bacterium]
MDKTRQDLVLGLVFFGALGILIWATIALTGVSLLSRPITREAVFPRGSGLKTGDNVFVLGYRLGQVGRLSVTPDAADEGSRVRVSLVFAQPIEFHEGYSITIESSGPLGGVQVEVDPGRGAGVIPEGAVLTGRVRAGGLEAIGDLFADGKLKADIDSILEGLRTAIDRANRGEGTLGKILTDSSLHDDLLAAVRSARHSLENIEKGEGVFGRLVGDKALGDSVADTVSRLDDLLAKIINREGLLGRFISDPELGDKGNRIFTDLAATTADLRAGRGTIGRLLVDESLAGRVDNAITHIDSAVTKIDDPKAGTIGALVGDTTLREKTERIVGDLADTVAEVRAGRGLLGKLIYDEQMGTQLERIFNQVSHAIEDAREAAPVATFFTVLSGAF